MGSSLAATAPESCEFEHGGCSGSQSSLHSPRLSVQDLIVAVVLGLAAFVLNAAGTWPLEFFRHTEADRMMIGMEMLQRGNFLVPRLLDSVILTKPPLFYWMIAGSAALFSDYSEWVGRLPSVLSGSLFVFGQYLLLVLSGLRRSRATLAAVVLATSLLFMQLGSSAEIDMSFGMFCGLGLSTFYLALKRMSLLWTGLAYVLFALAFLTKGPPIVFFAAGAFAAYIAAAKVFEQDVDFFNLLVLQLIGVGCFTLLVGGWIYFLGQEVGWPALIEQYDVEVHQRVFMESNRERSLLFYFGSFFIGMAPWTVLALSGAAWLLYSRPRLNRTPDSERLVVLYHSGLFLVGFILLSIAYGKSSRYLFPVYGSAAVGVAFLITRIKDTAVQNFWFTFVRWAFPPVAAGIVFSALYFSIDGVSRWGWLLSATAILAPLCLLWMSVRRRKPTAAIASLCIILLALRVAQAAVFAPHRNFTRSVKPVAAELQLAIPEGHPVYVMEMFERWIFYYMVREGRKVYRLDAPKASELHPESKIYLLLHKGEEYWRLNELLSITDDIEIIGEFSSPKEELVLVKVPGDAAAKMRIRRLFPTTRSAPTPYNNDPPASGIEG